MGITTEIQLSNGDLRAWLEQGQSVCIKASAKGGDPVELSSSELRRLIDGLTKFLEAIEAQP
jgi:nitroimidazol reductase NimA-like FMN-containing flavoprotein (pyridoxamine 5'-phosphate oxidase superfamily)